MIEIRRFSDLGHFQTDWLNAKHHFSFGGYYDPAHMGHGKLRVWNDDIIKPKTGFPTHGHRDMEIVSYVLDGALEHKDSIGTGSVIRPGDLQRMSAGTGIMHSEYNASQADPVHFLQIWIMPNQKGLEPGYEQTHFTREDKLNQLRLIGSQDGRDGSVTIHQDVSLYATVLDTNASVSHSIQPGRTVWVQVARGAVTLNGESMTAGDGAAVANEAELTLTGTADDTEVLVFDMVA